MRFVILISAIALLLVPSASASEQVPTKAQVRQAAKRLQTPRVAECTQALHGIAWYSLRYGHWMALRGQAAPNRVSRPLGCAHARWRAAQWRERSAHARAQYDRWLAERKRQEQQHPKWIALRLLGGDREQWSCLLYITDHENKAMDPTLDYGGGHGNVYEAYGIPQANPGYKMASAGADWRTNPETQLKWMIQYCRDRYGSVCGAAYSRRVNGMY